MLLRSHSCFFVFAMGASLGSPRLSAQSAPPPAPAARMLTLKDAEAAALQNHPQVQAAQHEVNYSNRQIVETRSAYYPNVTGDVTGSQANNLARIGAGDLTASSVYSTWPGSCRPPVDYRFRAHTEFGKELALGRAGHRAKCASHAL